LWKRLRRLDKQIAEADHWLYCNSWSVGWNTLKKVSDVETRRSRLDEQRRGVRMRLKGYKEA